MTDEFLVSLRSEWRARPDQVDAIEAAFARRRRRARLSLAGSALGIVLVAAGLSGLTLLALQQRDIAQIIAAFAFAVALPLLAFGFVQQARDMKFIGSMNSQDMLGFLRQQALRALHRLWGARACAVILGAAAAALLTSASMGAADVATAVFVTTLWLLTATLVWIWQRRRATRLTRKIARCDQVIAEFDVE